MTNIAGLHVVTDGYLAPDRTHEQIALAAVRAGVPVVQLRDKNMPDGQFYKTAVALRGITREAGALFIVNDRVDIALAVGADGVHVGQSDMPAPVARKLIGNDRILGVSATTIEEALKAVEDGASYIGFGPIFSTATKNDAAQPVGLEQLRALKSQIRLPIVAIGGIGESNIGSIAATGADGAAVVSAVVCADDMQAAAKRLMTLFHRV
jgi:thiamine-phosphate pyrophosphorylase